MPRHKWWVTNRDLKIITAMRAKGCGCADIAAAVNRSPASVSCISVRYKIPGTRRCITEEDKARIIELRKQGLLFREIGQLLDPPRSDQVVSSVLRRMRVHIECERYRVWSSRDEALRRMWVVEGLSQYQIAERLGRTVGSVAGRIHRLGLQRRQHGGSARLAGVVGVAPVLRVG
jgi:transcriptional regulator